MAIIILCLCSPSLKHRRDHHRHRRDTLISIVASLSSRQLLLLRLSLPLSDKVKQLHGDCISYNKATTIWLLPITDNITKHDHLIQNRITHHVLTISHHNMPYKNKLDILYFVVASFTWLLRAEQEQFLPTHQNHNDFSSSMCCFNLQQGPGVATPDSTKVGETDTRQPPVCEARR